MSKSGISTTLATTWFSFSLLLLNSIANIVDNYIWIKWEMGNKSLWQGKKRYEIYG